MPIAMTDHKHIGAMAKAEKNKPLFLLGVIRIVNQQCIFIIKNRLSFFKGYSMLFLIRYVLAFVPFKTQLIHTDIIITK